MEENLREIIQKLEAFIKKYLLYRMLKGLLITFSLIIFIFLFFSIIEFFSFFPVTSKKVILLICISFFASLIVYSIVLPLLSLLKLRRRISYTQAAALIGQYFPDIHDKLLNTIELGTLTLNKNFDKSLILASIIKRTEELRPFSFNYAINFKIIKRNFIFFVLSLIFFIAIVSFTPKVITNGTYRLMNYAVHFEPESPFKFTLKNKKLICERGKDFDIDLVVSGDYIPENVYINISGNSFLMLKEKKLNQFHFTIRNLNNNLEFQFSANTYNSENFLIRVLPAPVLKSFYIDITPPVYTGLEKRRILNSGDFIAPFGSNVDWVFSTSNVSNLKFVLGIDTSIINGNNSSFVYRKQIKESANYSVCPENSNFKSKSILQYNINVIPDLFPEIAIKMIEDSLRIGAYYYLINIIDDYGFNDLSSVKIIMENDSIKSKITDKIQFNKFSKGQETFYYFDFNQIENLNENSYVEYYFEVKDNDAVSGFKSSRTLSKIYKPITRNEIRDNIEKSEKLTEQTLTKSKKLVNDIQREIEDFKKKELNNELNEWDKQNYLKSIKEKQNNLDKFINEVKQEYQKKNQLNDQFYKDKESAIEKQKQVDELLNQILDDELKKLLEEIKNLTEKFDETQFEKLKDKIDFSYKNMEKKLDRTLELLKRFQVEDNMNRIAEDMEDLSEKQDSLSELKVNKKDLDQSIEEQKKLFEEFKQMQEEFTSTFMKNEELKSPFEMKDFKKSFNELNKEMEKLNNEMPSNSKKETKDQQKKFSNQMKKIAEDIKKMLNEMEMESNQENMENIRQLIDNLSVFSFSQENVFDLLNRNLISSPSFPEIISKQNKLKLDYLSVYDSLFALATRIPMIGQSIVKESDNIKFNLEKVTKDIEDRKRREGLSMQRLIMNSTNTLALLLEELMKQMQDQMDGSSSSGNKGGKPQMMQSLKKQQEKLKQELQKLLDKMKKDGGKPDQSGMNDQIIKTLAEQEIFNNMLKDMQNGKGINPETDQKLKEIKNLSDKNIDDLINKKITPELFNRNQKILTRLLEAEKSDQEREQEKKRESKEGRNVDFIIPDELKEILKKDNKYKESLQKNNLNLKKYYQNLSDKYFRNINN